MQVVRQSPAILNLLDVVRTGTRALGPGLRYAIWTQGCPFNCPGCITPQSRAIVAAKIVEVDSLARDIINNTAIEGLTISGGEPFLQAESLALLVAKVRKARPDLTIIVFTGFAIEKLHTPAAWSILARIDLLIDGQYIDRLNDGKGLRGSSNQRLHFLTSRLLPHRETLTTGKRQIEVTFKDQMTDIIGIPLRK